MTTDTEAYFCTSLAAEAAPPGEPPRRGNRRYTGLFFLPTGKIATISGRGEPDIEGEATRPWHAWRTSAEFGRCEQRLGLRLLAAPSRPPQYALVYDHVDRRWWLCDSTAAIAWCEYDARPDQAEFLNTLREEESQLLARALTFVSLAANAHLRRCGENCGWMRRTLYVIAYAMGAAEEDFRQAAAQFGEPRIEIAEHPIAEENQKLRRRILERHG